MYIKKLFFFFGESNNFPLLGHKKLIDIITFFHYFYNNLVKWSAINNWQSLFQCKWTTGFIHLKKKKKKQNYKLYSAEVRINSVQTKKKGESNSYYSQETIHDHAL